MADVMDKILKRIKDNAGRMVELQAALTAVPALAPENGGEGEWKKAQVLLSFLSKLGIREVEMLAAPDDRVPGGKRPNIVATIPGKSPKRLWIMSHMDIVPPGERSLWSSDPYKMEILPDRIIGRGVEDNQQAVVASTFAVTSILESGEKPAYTVKLLFVADEETASTYGIRYLLEHHKLFQPDDLVLVPDGGNTTGTDLLIAEKSLLWLKFVTKGKQCHGSRPQDGINAFVAASELALELYGFNTIYSQKNGLFDPPVSTFTPTKKEANVPNINTIPGEDVFYMDSRILPEVDLEEVLQRISATAAKIDKKYGTRISFSTIQRVSSPPTPRDAPIVRLLLESVKSVYGVDGHVIGIGGGTVGAFLRQIGLPVVVWARIADTAHMPNEYCLIENMVGDSQVMARLMMAGR